ncbi:MAG: hypothetical protein AAGM33_09670 [Pseudomonadota bacterium]
MNRLMLTMTMALAAPIALAVPAASAMAEETEAQYEIPTPPAGQGQIIFYRTGAIGGAALGCAVFNNEEKLSSLGAGRYFRLTAPAGEQSFRVKSLEAKDVLTLEIEPDETQFVRCKIKAGFLSGRANIAPSSEKEFRKRYKKPRLVDADDMSEAVRETNYPATETAASEAE